MSDLIHFVYWFACVFASALCVAEFAWDHWYFQSAAMSLLVPLCLSLMLGSFLFLGFWKICVRWRSLARLMKGDSIAWVSQANRPTTKKIHLRRLWFVLD